MRKVMLLFLCWAMLAGDVSLAALVDSGDGTVTDTSTGLMWQQATAPGMYTWQNALSYCENLTLAGYSDWRLPNRNELQSLVDYARYNPAIAPLLAPYTLSSHYWSSTTYAYHPPDSSRTWLVGFSDGIVDGQKDAYKNSFHYVRAVRTGSGQPMVKGDFSSDQRTGLDDAIIALQVCLRLPNSPIFQRRTDVNGDDLIGVEDVIYILQKTAGLK